MKLKVTDYTVPEAKDLVHISITGDEIHEQLKLHEIKLEIGVYPDRAYVYTEHGSGSVYYERYTQDRELQEKADSWAEEAADQSMGVALGVAERYMNKLLNLTYILPIDSSQTALRRQDVADNQFRPEGTYRDITIVENNLRAAIKLNNDIFGSAVLVMDTVSRILVPEAADRWFEVLQWQTEGTQEQSNEILEGNIQE